MLAGSALLRSTALGSKLVVMLLDFGWIGLDWLGLGWLGLN